MHWIRNYSIKHNFLWSTKFVTSEEVWKCVTAHKVSTYRVPVCNCWLIQRQVWLYHWSGDCRAIYDWPTNRHVIPAGQLTACCMILLIFCLKPGVFNLLHYYFQHDFIHTLEFHLISLKDGGRYKNFNLRFQFSTSRFTKINYLFFIWVKKLFVLLYGVMNNKTNID
jgi:hypothetical protein